MRPGKRGLFKYLRARLLLLSRDQPGSMAGREHLWEWGVTATNRLPLPAAASWRLGFQLGKELSEEGWKTILVSAPEKDLLPSHADQRCVTPPSLLSPSWIIPPRPSQSEIGRSGSQRAEWAPTYSPTQQSTTKSCLIQGIPLCCYRTKKPAPESWWRGSSIAKQISF